MCAGLDTDCIVLNLTHPVPGFPEVRMIMPGGSDFLPFSNPDVPISEATKPSAVWRGQEFVGVMESFFQAVQDRIYSRKSVKQPHRC